MKNNKTSCYIQSFLSTSIYKKIYLSTDYQYLVLSHVSSNTAFAVFFSIMYNVHARTYNMRNDLQLLWSYILNFLCKELHLLMTYWNKNMHLLINYHEKL